MSQAERSRQERWLTAAIRAAALLVVALAIVGGARGFSDVPFWDMWPGTLEFYNRLEEGHWREWWALHNEHRIVLARLLFWIDLTLFDGTVVFLIVANYLLVAGAFLTFAALLRERAGALAHSPAATWATLFLLASLFSWMQWENLGWGFQSQFFLAQWLPLLALYFLYRATLPQPGASRDFALACVVGVLCIGTMASGVVALPIMVAYALLLRMGPRRVGVLALLTALCLFAYFADYQSTPGHGSLRDVVRHQPVLLARYIALYIGGPFYYLTGQHWIEVGQLAGVAFIGLAAWKAVQCLRAPRAHALELALLAFILGIGGAALGTGAGRLLFGLHQATASRYTTPALMAWMALLVLYLPPLLRSLAALERRTVWPLIGVLAALLVLQTGAAESQRRKLFEREVAALALELGVPDDPQVKQVVFNTEWGLAIARRSTVGNHAIFGREWLRDAAQQLRQPAGALAGAACRGTVDAVEAVFHDPTYSQVAGWIAPPPGGSALQALRLVDARGTVVGYARVGGRPWRGQQGRDRELQPFKGYVLSEFAYQRLTLAPTGGACSLAMPPLPQPPFRFRPYRESMAGFNVGLDQVTGNAGWSGTDFERSQRPGVRVLGTYVTSDADTGRVTLRLKRGDSFFWRTGPSNLHQDYRIGEGPAFSGRMPRAETWVALVFDNPALPEEFTLTLSDAGTGWGEWSAIAVLDRPAKP